MKDEKGQSLVLVTAMIFIFILYTLLLTSQVLRTSKVSRFREVKEIDLWIAEAGVQKALWCFNNFDDANCGGSSGSNYVGESAVAFDVGSFTTTISDISPSQKALVSVASYRGIKKTITRVIEKGVDAEPISINHSIYSGGGGLNISGNPKVEGNVLSNGDVSCGGKDIDGDVTVSGAYMIDDCEIMGNAKANTIIDSEIEGDAYYQVINNTTVGGISYAGSPDVPFIEPVFSDEFIAQLKADAAAGTIIVGDYDVDDDLSLGPAQIVGNLTIKKNNSLTITGTIHVQGHITFETNSDLILHEDFGDLSGILISDGNITVNSAVSFIGTSVGGIITLLSTSTDDPAIDYSAGTPSSGLEVSICAPYGTVSVATGAKLLHACGETVNVANGANIQASGSVTVISYLSDITADTSWKIKPGGRNE